ncbi:ABC transporter permease [Sphaerisporangium krabiense]|uniref:NitT/TauT family transport system permease protein n=1 Tax=Sphaerisporangium krabiense TaxID=763782 RepID=A0A7W8Z602_9ACTN|nr:ABC transporter permease [Sphaerisporangium krabiense]MBB5627949.1 NitT/TauT family transport system permease protein [Sphaerisporangium krabiense]GII62109.1 ABC transporter permease [Sphaerisporangium krabiense]
MTDLDSVAAPLGTRPPASRGNGRTTDVPAAAPPESREGTTDAADLHEVAASRWGRTGAWFASAAKRSAALVVLVALWEFLPRSGLVDRVFVPPLSEDLAAWYELLRNGQLVEHLQASLVRSLAGFGLAIALAIPLGLAIGWYRPVAELLNPVLEVFRNTSPVALLPVFALILGIGETNKIVFVLYACSWPILLNTIGGVRTVEPLLIKSARSMGLGPLRLFQKVILPAAVPTIFTGVRLAGAYSILVLLFAEMVGAKAGLGYLIQASQSNFRITDMYAGIITISALGLAFNQVLVVVERRFSTWRTT